MKTILYISCSAREYHPEQVEHLSISRSLGEAFLSEYKSQYGQTKVIHRDLSRQPPSFITTDFLAATFSEDVSEEQQKILAESDALIQEVMDADVIVISSPMYNYGMPAVLKAWFDQVIRIGKTFTFDLARGDKPLEPILCGKKLVLLASWGEFNFKKGDSLYFMNHLTSHIEQLCPYLGAEQFFEIASEYQEFGDERHLQSKAQAFVEAKALARELA
ncbi:FMN-dependent NADH-azoreductase [Litoribrevibacter albus]|uniref:FMN dependent NADH:quinone oxidoreductase n=1 Tax=Litoribrevibacter albus TaxID=1473156 RepID=A0AA37SA30_9GAMM|nr:NAD(P)H-dependent oxidoreductase [Litoribrevibacter albus]GLQ30904.1 FMN-dependent NADH-azoreductase [Litoribrevibacter albus]